MNNLHMNIFFLVLIGILAGIVGGMGMGGGTLLIPLLTIFLSVNQHTAQGINLLAFIPMSIVAIIIHAKNKLIEKSYILPTLITALPAAGLGAFLSLKLPAASLKTYFGIFLIALGAVHLVIEVVRMRRERKITNNGGGA